MSRTPLRLAGGLLAVLCAVLVARPAAAEPRPSNPQGATVSLAATTVAAGQAIRFTGTGFVNEGERGQIVTIKLDDVDILGDVTASDSGAISGAVTIPAGTPAGSHWLRFLAGSGAENDGPARSLATDQFTVTAGGGTTTSPTPQVPGGELPKTGVDSAGWLAGALILPAAGLVLLVVERRRRQRAATADPR
ncbi:hypothetical protein [Polymorphospora lycopeni]|uniref:LPXTG cell wall anchor domain-containing protein n=1 Tax=Polymorphospora lycopeni TaxID=3140240 RepID=A0ABV5D171_9ACTN